MSLHEKKCPCGFLSRSAKGFATHTRQCKTYKDALNRRRPAQLLDNTANMEQTHVAIQATTIVQELPGLSNQFDGEELSCPLTNAAADVPMVFFIFFHSLI